MNLMAVCSKDPTRHSIAEPFSRGLFTYATDGRVLLRVDRNYDYPENNGAPSLDPRFFKFDHHLVPEEEWVDGVTSVERKFVDCDDCEGTGKVSKCPACDGKGEILCCCASCGDEHTHDCGRCDGSGKLPSGERSSCLKCQGTGKVDSPAGAVVMLGLLFGPEIVDSLLQAVGRFQIALPPKEYSDAHEYSPDGSRGVALVRFDGGVGYLMARFDGRNRTVSGG